MDFGQSFYRGGLARQRHTPGTPLRGAGPSRAGAVCNGGSRTARKAAGWRSGSNPGEPPESPAPPSGAGHRGRPQSRRERSWTAGTVSEHPCAPDSAVFRPGETPDSRPLGCWDSCAQIRTTGRACHTLAAPPPGHAVSSRASLPKTHQPKDPRGTPKMIWGAQKHRPRF